MADDDVSGCTAFFVCQRHPTAKSKAWLGLQYGAGDELASEASRVSFCFPVAAEMHETRRVAAPEEYSYTMTGDKGDRSHGFCRKIYWSPSYKSPKYPFVFCLVSCELWPIFYFKVLEVVQELLMQERLLTAETKKLMPKECAAAKFLDSVKRRLTTATAPGSIITVRYPEAPGFIQIEAPQKINALNAQTESLKSTPELIELQVPPLTGRSPAMSGVSLARLLWRIPVKCLMTLMASLLLERRIIMVCKSKDTLSASIHAASALIYPFEWSHRFYLPIMPESMRHFLQAPFPFLVGLPAELMDFKGLEMDEVTLIDLDLGTCRPEPGSEMDDASFLPKNKKLEAALHEAVKALRSPTEFEGNFRIAEIVTGYFVSLFKHYRQFISRKDDPLTRTTQARSLFKRNGNGTANRDAFQPRPQSEAALDLFSKNDFQSVIDGHGFFFDHSKFVTSHRSKKDRAFLELFRQSQMYEVFIRQRLEMASIGTYPKDDPFEYKINLITEFSRKLEPGELGGRTWSRRLSIKPLPQKLSAMAGATMRKSLTLVHGDAAVLKMDELQQEPLLVESAALATVSKRRLGVLRQSNRPMSKTQSIKKIVTDMARESSRRLSRPVPGNFLQRSRASFAERDVSALPEDDQAPEGDDAPQEASESVTAAMQPITDREEEEETTDSSEDSGIAAESVRDRSVVGGCSPNSFEVQTSPWLDTPEQSIFDAWNASSGTGRRSMGDSWFDSSSESSYRHQRRMSLRTESGRDTESLMITLSRARSEETAADTPGEAEMTSPEEKTPLSSQERKQRQVDAFLESNLKELSNSQSVKLGLPPKPQRYGGTKAPGINQSTHHMNIR